MSTFNVIVGQTVYAACYVHDYIQLSFDKDFGLTISNDFELVGVAHIGELVGKRLVAFDPMTDRILLRFEKQAELIVDLRDSAWHGPEALYLRGPDNFMTVWTYGDRPE